jgi:hypothetical protein
LKKIEKPIEKSKFENLVTLLQLTPLVDFWQWREKFEVPAEIFHKLLAFDLNIGWCKKLCLVSEILEFIRESIEIFNNLYLQSDSPHEIGTTELWVYHEKLANFM